MASSSSRKLAVNKATQRVDGVLYVINHAYCMVVKTGSSSVRKTNGSSLYPNSLIFLAAGGLQKEELHDLVCHLIIVGPLRCINTNSSEYVCEMTSSLSDDSVLHLYPCCSI